MIDKRNKTLVAMVHELLAACEKYDQSSKQALDIGAMCNGIKCHLQEGNPNEYSTKELMVLLQGGMGR